MPTMSIERFVYLRNLAHLRTQLVSTTDEAKCRRIVKMIEDEELKYRASGGDSANRRVSARKGDKSGRAAQR